MASSNTLDIIAIGNSVRDVMFYTNHMQSVKNPRRDPLVQQLLCVEYGAKIRSEEVYFLFGGGGSNTAVNFAGLGLRTGVITAVGDDLDGRAILQHLRTKRVDTTLVTTDRRQRTGFSFLAVDKRSGEHTVYVYYGAAQQLTVTPAALRRKTEWYYLSSINTLTWKQSVRRLCSTRRKIAWNPGGLQLHSGYRGLKSYLPHITVFILNADEARELIISHGRARTGSMEHMAQTIHSWGPHMVLITNGRAGSWVYDGNDMYFHKPPQDHPKDTAGAGDSFGSSFVAGYIRYNGDIAKALRLATLNATHNVHVIGAQEGLLKWSQLPAALRRTR